MTDWSSYDGIAARYDELWGDRFESAARRIWERVPLTAQASVLDVGTGTGAVLYVLGSQDRDRWRLTGCDKSAGMIRVARRRVPAARFVAADAVALPFPDGLFDAATASFVLSHLLDCGAGLREVHRILKPGGAFAMTSWAAQADEHSEAWSGLLADEVSRDLVEAAVARVAPSEGKLETAADVANELAAAGLARVEVHALTLEYTISLEHFLADREIGSSGRYARDALGAEAWSRFTARAGDVLRRRFGSLLRCSRGVLLGRAERGG